MEEYPGYRREEKVGVFGTALFPPVNVLQPHLIISSNFGHKFFNISSAIERGLKNFGNL
jgi:hypothetical protein